MDTLLINDPTLAEEFHVFRHIIKDLVNLFQKPLEILLSETVTRDFQHKFGISVRSFKSKECKLFCRKRFTNICKRNGNAL